MPHQTMDASLSFDMQDASGMLIFRWQAYSP